MLSLPRPCVVSAFTQSSTKSVACFSDSLSCFSWYETKSGQIQFQRCSTLRQSDDSPPPCFQSTGTTNLATAPPSSSFSKLVFDAGCAFGSSPTVFSFAGPSQSCSSFSSLLQPEPSAVSADSETAATDAWNAFVNRKANI